MVLYDQGEITLELFVDLRKAGRTRLNLDPAVDLEERHRMAGQSSRSGWPRQGVRVWIQSSGTAGSPAISFVHFFKRSGSRPCAGRGAVAAVRPFECVITQARGAQAD